MENLINMDDYSLIDIDDDTLINLDDFQVPKFKEEDEVIDDNLLIKLGLIDASKLNNTNKIDATPYNSNENNIPKIKSIETNHIRVSNLTNTDIKFHILYIDEAVIKGKANLSLDSRYFSPGYIRQMSYPKTTRYAHIIIKALLKDKREYPVEFGTIELLKDFHYEISESEGNFIVKIEEDIL